MSSVILTHLGSSVPLYISECVHQIRLWNPITPIYIILEPVHNVNSFWETIESTYSNIVIVYTNTLTATKHHTEFTTTYIGDTVFRNGYWKHVRERFFYVEELMDRDGLTDVIAMEYDVLVYGSLSALADKLRTSHRTLRMVMDNDTRGHPGFMYIPDASEMRKFTEFLAGITGMVYEDMQSLALYAKMFEVHCLPVITDRRNYGIEVRKSSQGHSSKNVSFLSEDSEHFGVLFDSLVAGQWLGGIDLRNTGGAKILNYENEGALYRFREMPFEWIRGHEGLWQPILDNRPLFTIHMHSKALICFLSDRVDKPVGDYNVHSIVKTLLPNY